MPKRMTFFLLLKEDSFEVLGGNRSDKRLVCIKSDLPGHTALVTVVSVA